MKIIKYVVLILLVIALLYTGLCALFPKNFNMVQDTKIEAPAQVVYNLINNLGAMEQWNDWNLQDTSMVVTYGEQTIGVGGKTSWTSKTSGNGSQEIIESIKNEKVKTMLNFEGYEVSNFAEFNISENGKKTDLSWSFESGEDLPFLMRGAMGLMGMKKSMKKSYKAGLKNIKKIAEERSKHNQYNGYKITQAEVDAKNYIMTRQEVSFDKITQFFGSSQGPLFSKIQSAGIEMQGRPCGLFFRYNEKNGVTDMATAIPIESPISISGTSSYSIPAKNALQVDFYGEFANTQPAHYAIADYMRDHDLLQDAPIIEEYVTDTNVEKDPSKWLTRITYYYSPKG